MQLHLQTGFKLLGLVQGKIVKRLNLFWIVLSLRAFVFLKKSFALVFSHPVVLHPPFRSILRGSGKDSLEVQPPPSTLSRQSLQVLPSR